MHQLLFGRSLRYGPAVPAPRPVDPTKLDDVLAMLEGDPRWHLLNSEARASARRRAEAVVAYVHMPKPRAADVAKLIATSGLSASAFYALAKRWRSEASFEALVPYARARGKSRPKIDAPAASEIDAMAEQLLGENPRASIKAIADAVNAQRRSLGLPPHSATTVGRRVRVHMRRRQAGSPAGDLPQIEVQGAWLRTLVVDFLTLDTPVRTGSSSVALPCAIVVFDRWSHMILGFHLSPARPKAVDLARALIDLTARLPDLPVGDTYAPASATTLLMPPLYTDGWQQLTEAVQAARITIKIRVDDLGTGRQAWAAIGPELRDLGLPVRQRLRRTTEDALARPPASAADVRMAAETAVRLYNQRRAGDLGLGAESTTIGERSLSFDLAALRTRLQALLTALEFASV